MAAIKEDARFLIQVDFLILFHLKKVSGDRPNLIITANLAILRRWASLPAERWTCETSISLYDHLKAKRLTLMAAPKHFVASL
jgi:hypothetical protein